MRLAWAITRRRSRKGSRRKSKSRLVGPPSPSQDFVSTFGPRNDPCASAATATPCRGAPHHVSQETQEIFQEDSGPSGSFTRLACMPLLGRSTKRTPKGRLRDHSRKQPL